MSESQWVSEKRPYTGQWSARDTASVPDGGSQQEQNIRNIPGNPYGLGTRKGMPCLVNDGDREAALPYASGEEIEVGDWRQYAGESYRANTEHTADTMVQDVDLWDRRPSIGIHAGSGNTSAPGVMVQVQRSNGETLLTEFFVPWAVYSIPINYLSPENEPPVVPDDPDTGPNPVAAEDPEPAYLIYTDPSNASSGVSTVNHVFQVDINALSGTADNARVTAVLQTTGYPHRNGWVIKGPDRVCYFLFWKRMKDDDTKSGTHFGRWDGSTSYLWYYKSRYKPRDDRGYRWASDDNMEVVSWLTIDSNGDLILVGDNDHNYDDVEPNPPKGPDRVNGERVKDLAWRWPTGRLLTPSTTKEQVNQYILLLPEAVNALLKPTPNDSNQCQRDHGSPHIFPLPNNRFFQCSTTRSLSEQQDDYGDDDDDVFYAGTAVSLWEWSGEIPQRLGYKVFSTSRHSPGNSTDNNGFNAWSVCRCAPVSATKIVVARGTSGASIYDFATGEEKVLTPSVVGHDIIGVAANPVLKQVFLQDASAFHRIYIFTDEGIDTGINYSSVNYSELGGDFRGMTFSADMRFLWVWTYVSGASAGSKVKQVGIPLLIPPWVTATNYVPGNLVVESGSLYQCLLPHQSGTFSKDKTTKWGKHSSANVTVPTVFALNLGAYTSIEQHIWASGDPAGSYYRNIAIVGGGS